MLQEKKTIYLLGGNGSNATWWQFCLKHFKNYQAIPIELPGFGNKASAGWNRIDQYAEHLLRMTQPGHTVLACGASAVVVLHAATKNAWHFKKIYLLAPIGAFLWQRRLPKILRSAPLVFLHKILLSRWPRLFARQLCTKPWRREHFKVFAKGHRQCRAFSTYFNMITPSHALTLLEHIDTPVHLIWGKQDQIVDIKQVAAWEAILCKAPLQISIMNAWGHYPYIEYPEEFAAVVDGASAGFAAHTKAGRLKLAKICGLNVPSFETFQSKFDLVKIDTLPEYPRWVIRSSIVQENKTVHPSNMTILNVKPEHVSANITQLLKVAGNEVIAQHMLQSVASGVAFVRRNGLEVEWVYGPSSEFLHGRQKPKRFIWSDLGEAWCHSEIGVDPLPLPVGELKQFLLDTLAVFHYRPMDIEWLWDGHALSVLNIQPIVRYAWHRYLTPNTFEDVLPATPSLITETALRRAASSIPAIIALWDPHVLEDCEPFIDQFEEVSYLNADFILTRLHAWGLPSHLLEKHMGGVYPEFGFNAKKFIRHLPMFLSMILQSRRATQRLETRLLDFYGEFQRLIHQKQSFELVFQWYVRFYVFILQSNIVIQVAQMSAVNDWLSPSHPGSNRHARLRKTQREKKEVDIASPHFLGKKSGQLTPYPKPNNAMQILIGYGLPGVSAHFLEVRYWLHENILRVCSHVHDWMAQQQQNVYWFRAWKYQRRQDDGFWQNSGENKPLLQQQLIYPGNIRGKIGEDVLIVEYLDISHSEKYQASKLVIARNGGALSRAATLLRQLKIPSAILPNIESLKPGTLVEFSNGKLRVVPI